MCVAAPTTASLSSRIGPGGRSGRTAPADGLAALSAQNGHQPGFHDDFSSGAAMGALGEGLR